MVNIAPDVVEYQPLTKIRPGPDFPNPLTGNHLWQNDLIAKKSVDFTPFSVILVYMINDKVEQPVSSYTEFEKLKWVSTKPIPAVGSEVNVKINGIGRSKVLKYFVEHGFIGLVVQPQNPPTWYIKQNGDDPCHVFPAECTEFEVRNDDGSVDQEFYDSQLRPADQTSTCHN